MAHSASIIFRWFLASTFGRPGVENQMLSLESDTEASPGRLGKARDLSRQAVEIARRSDEGETAALWQANEEERCRATTQKPGLHIKISSPHGRLPTPTFPSSSLQNPNTNLK
jgi:hypothetical protein